MDVFCRNSMMIEETTFSKVEETRPWSDLPHELLSPIADRLCLIELLCFRGACKDWRTASSTSSAQIESSPNHNPWFILYGGEENSQFLFYNPSTAKCHRINFPELEGSTCLASKHGWLLFFCEGSMFFFCPFTRAKIDLPKFPHVELSDHVATLSSPPTSEDCIVCVINRKDIYQMELNVLHRGAEMWTKIDHDCPWGSLETVTSAAYFEGIFYFLDAQKKLLTYAINKKKWAKYLILDREKPSNSGNYLPFTYKVNYFMKADLKNCLALEDDVSVSTCGTTITLADGDEEYDLVIHNERVEASKVPTTRHLKGIWIQPRFLQIAPNQSWSL
ncbi:F-box/kelch-repeat protein [Actinidia chinensis var. chinensis]|uniref:F-box/kelch-repeat protein n=1 Tax=Actinidia chinensis var. chinensis TaxID=1590841 RepID=A0A2R6QE83_ACTCC|nr:F-box/kelch-repeat protein [Actinidia chinensis var. chinensis]